MVGGSLRKTQRGEQTSVCGRCEVVVGGTDCQLPGGILAVSKQFVKEAKGIIRGCRKAGTIVRSGKGGEGPPTG